MYLNPQITKTEIEMMFGMLEMFATKSEATDKTILTWRFWIKLNQSLVRVSELKKCSRFFKKSNFDWSSTSRIRWEKMWNPEVKKKRHQHENVFKNLMLSTMNWNLKEVVKQLVEVIYQKKNK